MKKQEQTESHARAYASDLLTIREKTEQDIEDAKKRVDENEK
jgi:hypothetical protein